ncbi:MAG: hypothetical protein ABH883_00360 [Candidatus Omnitrophota bacterium]
MKKIFTVVMAVSLFFAGPAAFAGETGAQKSGGFFNNMANIFRGGNCPASTTCADKSKESGTTSAPKETPVKRGTEICPKGK